MLNPVKKIIIISVVLANLLLVFYFWWQSSSPLLFLGQSEALISLGRISGLLLVFLVLLQILLMGRARFLESVWGLDKLSRIHHWNGILTVVFLIAHPFFLVSGYALAEGVGRVEQFLAFIRYYDDVAGGLFAVFIFFLVIASSIIIIRKKWNFEIFYFIHLSVYFATLIAFGHQLELGGDFAGHPVFAFYWWLLYFLVFGFIIGYRWLLPLYNSYRFRFTILEIKQETHNVLSIKITGQDIDKFKIQPGQFMIFRFLTSRLWWQAHPFSLSGRGLGYIRITVKAVGDYTRELKQLRPGDYTIIEGPYGIFTSRTAKQDKFLLIAGGIGITPIYALAAELSEKNKDIALLYGNRTAKDIVFFDELNALAGPDGLAASHVLSRENNVSHEQGLVDEEKIRRLVPDYLEREVYVCGPVKMMMPLLSKLKAMGVRSRRLHYERFSL